MHFFSKEKNFLGGHGIVGGQIPLGAGLAFGAKYKGEDKISLCMMGDGAVRQGSFHETMNLAMLWNLPVIFIIENNHYAMGTSVERTSNVTDLYKLGLSYEMPSKPVDGMNVLEVYEEMKEAVEFVRGGNGPMLIEMKTYRYKGHSMSDPAKYRTREEVQKVREEKDPIDTLRSLLIEKHKISEKEFKAKDAEIKGIVTQASDFALESPEPAIEDLWTDVYAS